MAIDLASLQTILNLIFAPSIADNLNQTVVLGSRLKKTIGGGKNIAWDVKTVRGTSAASYASGADITGNDNDTEVPATLGWKRLKGEFKVSGDAIAAAASGGPQAYANLFGKQIKDATKNLAKQFGSQIYGDGTGNSGLDLDGLAAIVAATGTYAGIDRAATAIWRSNVLANSGTPRALTVDLMRLMERTIYTVSGFQPDFIVTTPIIYEKYAALFDSIKRVMAGDDKTFDLGTSTLAFQGIPIIRDAQCPSGKMYFLTQDELEFQQLPFVNEQSGMSLTDGTDQLESQEGEIGLQVGIEMLGKSGDSYKGFIKLYGNMVSEHPNQHGVIADINES